MKLGLTLVHEHVFNKFPPNKRAQAQAFALAQLRALVPYGVKTIVDLTPYTSPENYREVLENSPIKIIPCAGFYTPRFIPANLKRASVAELVAYLEARLEGAPRPGILKVAGWSCYPSELEKRLFSAIAVTQARHHLPVATHSPKGALAQLALLKSSGGDLRRTFFSHLDYGLTSVSAERKLAVMRKVLDAGAFVLFTEFGSPANPAKARLTARLVAQLKKEGYLGQLLISADSNWTWVRGSPRLCHHSSNWAGRSYAYVFKVILPALRSHGFSDAEVDTILVQNPKRLFSFS